MKLIEIPISPKSFNFFPQRDFILFNDKDEKIGNLMLLETIKGAELDLSIIIDPKYLRCGYATMGIKLLIEWAIKNGYQRVTLTNMFNSRIIERIATKLNFSRRDNTTWSKSIIGPLNI